MKLIVIKLIVILSIASIGMAATTNTSGSGPWNTGGNWDNGVPGGADDANVNHDMTIDVNIGSTQGDYIFNNPCTDPAGGGAFNLSVQGTGGNQGLIDISANVTFEGTCNVNGNGTLIIRSGDTLTVGATTFANNSIVVIEPNAVLIINGDLANNNNSTNVTIDGNIFVNGNVTGGNGSSMGGVGGIDATGTITTSGSGTIFGSSANCTMGPCSAGPGAVPVELAQFLVERKNDGFQICWEVFQQINNRYFIVQRSFDGQSFESIYFEDGEADSYEIKSYCTYDLPDRNGIVYYRLIQEDLDGTLNFLAEKRVWSGFSSFSKGWVYPNPIRGNSMFLNPLLKVGTELEIIFYNPNGEKKASISIESPAVSQAINLPENLVSGTYLVEIITESGVKTFSKLVLD